MGLRSLLGTDGDGVDFDSYDEFVADHLPDPGTLAAGRLLEGREHCAVHRLACELFEERAVYDMTFGYNLARLNNDPRYPDAGFRYAVERTDEARVLWAAFTPTTSFCPQTDTLTVGAFRAWNGLSDRHEYDLVRVRAAPTHHRSESINDHLHGLEATYRETGSLPTPDDEDFVGSAGEDADDSPRDVPF